ncbi:PAS domain S-box protein [Allomuricauda sp. M10]|uniref:PAS domain S-box protein n=1 Tax=Allomuricauda sp. M10 TaxID=2683292 RepID=UPI001D190453|nr:PAS domain S-box protein [Muricauda sp. M10]
MVYKDVTLLHELKHNHGFSDVFLETIRDGLLISDTDGTVVMVNSILCKMTGFSKEELLGTSAPYPFWPPELYDTFRDGVKQTLNEDFKGEYETVHLRKGGERFPVWIFVASIKNQEGRVVAHLALMQDLSEERKDVSNVGSPNQELFTTLSYRKKYMDLLVEKKLLSQLDYTLNNISDGIISLDKDWNYTYINQNAAAILGRTPSSLIGKNIWEEYPGVDQLSFYKVCLEAFETQQKKELTEYYGPLGKWFENRFYPSPEGMTVYFSDVTDKKSAEASLVHKEKLLGIINKSVTQPLFILEVSGRDRFKFISVSQSFLEAMKITENDVMNKFADELVSGPTLLLLVKNCNDAIKSKGTVQYVETTPKPDQSFKTALISISPLFNDQQQCTNLVGLVNDITEIKRIEEHLLESKNYLDNILNNIGDPIFVKDDESRLLLVNDAFCSIFDLSRPDILGKTLVEDVSQEEGEEFLKIDRQVLESGKEILNEESLTVRGGETKIISTKKTRFVDEKGKKFLIGIIRDITERKKTELELKSAKEYSENLIDSMHEGLVVFNMHTEITGVNPSFCKMSGFSEEELIGQQCPYPFSPPEIEDESNLRHEKIEKGETLDNFETIYMRKDGSRFNVDVMISLLRNDEDRIISYFATVIDTTARKKAEQELKLAKEFTDNLVMSMQEGLIIVNLEGKIILVNDSTCNILGYARDELIGLTLPYPFAKPEDFQTITKTNRKVAAGEAPSFQFEFIRKNGEMFLATFLTGNITNDKGEVIALFGTMKDISDEVKARTLLVESAQKSTKKKDVILKLAGLVGKDFKDSLNLITQLAAETLNVERVSVWKFNVEGTTISCENLYSLGKMEHSEGMVISKIDNPKYFEALEKKQTVLVNNIQTDDITKMFLKDYLVPNNIKSLMDVFVNSADGYYGIICFEHVGNDSREWSADEQEFATSIANIVSLMVESTERKIAEEKLIRSNEELANANSELNELRTKLELENIYLRNELDLVFNFEEMVYGSAAFSNVLTEVEKVAPTNATVLLLGESGTGKELLARAIHNIGSRNTKPLIKVNCSAIPRELIESELFGHKKGSFTGAVTDKVGKFELANGGTLFLDEIGELPIDMQPKILRFLQEGEIEVVGGTEIKKVDVRVIAATNRNLKEEIEKKRFREDLYFRLNVFPIMVPALRDRKEDIPLLVEHFVDKFNKHYNKNIKYVTDAAMDKLKSYDWPGNIRELENLIERASILSNGETLVIPGFESEAQKAKMPIKEKNMSLETIQRNHIIGVLEKCNWKISGPNSASVILELKPSTLRDKMLKLGIQKND